ncbi:hypothetical protein M408DRAFT_78379 [Serendipita vermifera MAFF 305830]|uniref:DUF1753-domain-containing protein n=1 Tax=Serendipita vermifera MAFF 305830 TaxID=933852 RepID=A0A0C2W8Q5_SERVB|nr:hypothetical protein M408DRAFT_78379 [Serendipita vermifera MAFF 305830]
MLSLRQDWSPQPLSSFLFVLDLKTGVQVALYFALLNKVAGTYGLLALFTGGSLAQLSLYLYSIAGLFAYIWALRAVLSENPGKSTITANIFLLDHIISTLSTAFFGVAWWVFTPHDGRRIINSAAQVELATGGAAVGHHPTVISEAQRTLVASELWSQERAYAAAILILGWVIKGYFCVVLYSYAFHLRNNSYQSLPLSWSSKPEDQYPDSPDLSAVDQELDVPDLYKHSNASGLVTAPLSGRPSTSRHTPMLSSTSFTEFVGAHNNRTSGWPEHLEEVEEVVFDEEEAEAAEESSQPKQTTEAVS